MVQNHIHLCLHCSLDLSTLLYTSIWRKKVKKKKKKQHIRQRKTHNLSHSIPDIYIKNNKESTVNSFFFYYQLYQLALREQVILRFFSPSLFMWWQNELLWITRFTHLKLYPVYLCWQNHLWIFSKLLNNNGNCQTRNTRLF